MNKIKNILLVVLGMIVMYGISNAYILNASEVTYDKKNTTLESENISGAVNELGVLATTKLSEIEEKINVLNNDLNADGLQFKFGTNGDGNYGYYGADGSLIPFKNGSNLDVLFQVTKDGTDVVESFVADKDYEKIGFAVIGLNTVSTYVHASISASSGNISYVHNLTRGYTAIRTGTISNVKKGDTITISAGYCVYAVLMG